MTDNTLSTTKKLLKPIVGDSNNEWGGFLNTTIDQIDSTFGGTLRRTLTGDITLSTSDIINTGYYFVGTLTTTTRITFPTYYGTAVVRNGTTQRLTIGMVSGATVTIYAGTTTSLWSDGQDFVAAALGYPAVQQGGGSNQGTNKIYLGYNSATGHLRAQVDSTDLGDMVSSADMGALIAGASLPMGMIVLWYGSIATVPTGWHLCDGTNGTPDLRDRFVVGAGNSYSPADKGGAVTQTVASGPGGAHSHGDATGAAAPTTDAQGGHSHGGATTGHQLTLAEVPSHDHGGFSGKTVILGDAGGLGFGGGPVRMSQLGFAAQGGDGSHSHGIFADGSHAHNVNSHAHTIGSDGSHAHSVTIDVRPSYYALAYIMKL